MAGGHPVDYRGGSRSAGTDTASMNRMARKSARRFCALAALLAMLSTASPSPAALRLKPVWSHGAGGLGRAEIVAYDSVAEEFLVVNGTERCVMRLDAGTGRELGRLDLRRHGDPTSVAASHGLIAVAVVAPEKTAPGSIVIYRPNPTNRPSAEVVAPAAIVRVPAMPDMVTFTPDGRYILSANEGEPSDDYRVDPEGSVSVIDVGNGPDKAVALTAGFVAFDSHRDRLEKQGVRVTGPNPTAVDSRASIAQDVEPEFIAVTPDGTTAWVTLQENNALAEVDIRTALVRRIVGLGLKDHSRTGNGFDASDRDGGPCIHTQPVLGMYQPDGISAFESGGDVYLATANEGDGRDYVAFADGTRVANLTLDESFLVNHPGLADEKQLGRLVVSRVGADIDGDGDADRLLAFGARSLAIWDSDGQLVYDSGDSIERWIAEHLPDRFNIEGDGATHFDTRSDDKGPEPEGIVVGRVNDATYAFVGLERTSAIAVFDVTHPTQTKLIDVVPLALTADETGGPHIAPEGLCFVPAERSPLGEPLLAVACEVTGTTILYRLDSVESD